MCFMLYKKMRLVDRMMVLMGLRSHMKSKSFMSLMSYKHSLRIFIWVSKAACHCLDFLDAWYVLIYSRILTKWGVIESWNEL